MKYYHNVYRSQSYPYNNTKDEETLNHRKITDSLTQLIDLLAGKETNGLFSYFPQDINNILFCNSNSTFDAALYVPKSRIYCIDEKVRVNILDWTFMLEDSGILGENLSFADIETDASKSDVINKNYITNIYGNVSYSSIKKGEN